VGVTALFRQAAGFGWIRAISVNNPDFSKRLSLGDLSGREWRESSESNRAEDE
jgi:hypothetical protein